MERRPVATIYIGKVFKSAKAKEAQNCEHDDDSADKPDQIVHWERSPV